CSIVRRASPSSSGIVGRLSDLIGRKPIWLAGMALFALGSGATQAFRAPPKTPDSIRVRDVATICRVRLSGNRCQFRGEDFRRAAAEIGHGERAGVEFFEQALLGQVVFVEDAG